MLPAEVRARLATTDGDVVVVATARRLTAATSTNLPGDTGAAACIAAELVRSAVPRAQIELHDLVNGTVNLVAPVRTKDPGRRILRSDHLNTYPISAVRSRAGSKRGNGGGGASFYRRRPAIKSTNTHPTAKGSPGRRCESIGRQRGDNGRLRHAVADRKYPTYIRLAVWRARLRLAPRDGKRSGIARGVCAYFVNFIDRLRRAFDAVCESSNLSFAVPKGVVEAIRLAQTVPGEAAKAEVLFGMRKDQPAAKRMESCSWSVMSDCFRPNAQTRPGKRCGEPAQVATDNKPKYHSGQLKG